MADSKRVGCMRPVLKGSSTTTTRTGQSHPGSGREAVNPSKPHQAVLL